MQHTELLARNYTDEEVRRLLLDMFSHVREERVPFFVRLLRRMQKK